MADDDLKEDLLYVNGIDADTGDYALAPMTHEALSRRYAEMSTTLADTLEDIQYGEEVDPKELTTVWTSNNDARGYVVLGDPAVRLGAR